MKFSKLTLITLKIFLFVIFGSYFVSATDISLGIKNGLNLATWQSEINNKRMQFKKGYIISGMLDIKFVKYFSFQPEILFSMKGYKEEGITQMDGSGADYSERKDILFIGGFRHQPNVDAVIYFCQEILPLIRTSVPDVTFFIDIPIKEVLRRKNNISRNELDRIEVSKNDFFERVRAGYKTLAKNKERFIVLDGLMKKEEIHSEIKHIVKKLLKD